MIAKQFSPKTLLAAAVATLLLIATAEYFVLRPTRAAHARTEGERARLAEENAATEANLLSPEATEAWVQRVDTTNAEWERHLDRIPGGDRVEEQYTAIKDLARASGVNILGFERKAGASSTAPVPQPGSPDAGAGERVSPGVERRQIQITFAATIDTLGRLHQAIAAYPHPISIDEYTAKSKTRGSDTIEVAMVISSYFRRRAPETGGADAK